MMNIILTVFRKEVLDNFRDRRTLLRSVLFGALFGPVFFAVVMNTALKLNISDIEKPLAVPTIGAEHAPNLVAYLEEHKLQITEGPADPEAAVRSGKADLVLVIPAAYGKAFSAGAPAQVQLVVDGSNKSSGKVLRRVRGTLETYARRTAALKLLARGIDPRAAQPVVVMTDDIATAQAKGALLFGMVPYFLIFAILLGGFYLAIDTTAGERERGSLEPLLSTAAPRSALIYGKLGATIVFSILALAVSVAAFAFSLPLVHVEQIGLAINMNASMAWHMFLVAIPFTVVGGAILTVVASLTKSFKEAQTWLSVVLVIPLIPTIITALYPVHAAWWMMLVPSLSQNLLLTDLLKGTPLDPMHIVLSVASTLLIGVILAILAAHLFARESVVD